MPEQRAPAWAPGHTPSTVASRRAPPRRVANRYELGELIGTGGFGSVYRAVDEVTGSRVAVKLLQPLDAQAATRADREVAALRLVNHPSVVFLLDHGEDEGERFLVMPLIAGRAFPGALAPVPWEQLRPVALRLLDGLRAVHDLGVVHRDLKPANVLVEDGGAVRILDFGLARGEALGNTVTASGALLGTPRYLAPEQLSNGRIDARADLYAIGVMLFEALAGRPPFAESGPWAAWVFHRTRVDAPSLSRVAPPVPAHVAAVVDHLLSRDRERRPGSVGEVLARLAGTGGLPELPLLGRDALLTAVLGRLRAGEAVDVCGPSGVGCTRLLDEVDRALAAEGRRVLRLPPARAPLESLAAVLGPIPPTDAPATMEHRLRSHLGDGGVLLLDRVDTIDHRSRAVVSRARDAGAILRVEDAPGALQLAPLTAEDLRPLFLGPDRILHLGEDAARALHRRTGGLPGRVVAELYAWLEAGHATLFEGRVRLTRPEVERLGLEQAVSPALAMPECPEELDTLLGWVGTAGTIRPDALATATGLPAWEVEETLGELEALGVLVRSADGTVSARASARCLGRWSEDELLGVLRALADALPPGHPGRLSLMLRAGDADGAAAEALVRARSPDVRVGRALAELRACLVLVPAGSTTAGALAAALTRLALADGSSAVLRLARRDVERAGRPDLARLLDASERAAKGDERAAGEMMGDAEPLPEPALDADRRLLTLRALSRTDPAAAEAALTSVSDDDPTYVLRRRSWLAQLRYRQGRWEEAAFLHLACAEDEIETDRRIRALINAGGAFLDALRVPDALGPLRRAREESAQARLVVNEAFAEVWLRAAAYRTGTTRSVDDALLDALTALGGGSMLAIARVTEAAVAWRSGSLPRGLELAAAAATDWRALGQSAPALLADGLAVACGGRPEDPAALVASALSCPLPRLGAQTLALLARSGWPAPEGVREVVDAAAAGIPPERAEVRMEVLSLRECREILGES